MAGGYPVTGEGEERSGNVVQPGTLPETSALRVAAAGGARGLRGSQFGTGAATRGTSTSGGGDGDGDGDGDDGEASGAEELVEFQRLVTVAVQKGMMGMSDARVSGQPIDVFDNGEGRMFSVLLIVVVLFFFSDLRRCSV